MTRRLATQTRLTLPHAIPRAWSQSLDALSAVAAEREAAQRVTQARAGYFPNVDNRVQLETALSLLSV